MKDQKICEGLLTFIEKNSVADLKKITSESDIEHDLHLKGHDAVNFILEFSKHFNVDVSQFLAKNYFSADGLDMLFFIKPKRKKIKIAHLENAIFKGVLNETTINE